MTNSELHWYANDLMVKGIFSIQIEIESYKEELKFLQDQKGKSGAIHDPAQEKSILMSLKATRSELLIHEYMQDLLDQASTQKSTIETVRDYISKQNPTRNT